MAGELAGIERQAQAEARLAWPEAWRRLQSEEAALLERRGVSGSLEPEHREVEVVIRAAGGVVRRREPDGPKVALVHRPRYDDWTLPKGKADRGEADEASALREVLEETGLRCELGPEVASVRYRDHYDRPKVVRYWLMYPSAGAFVPNDEVDRMRWVRPDEAIGLLTYGHDRDVVRRATAFDRPCTWCAMRRRGTGRDGPRTTRSGRSPPRGGVRRRAW